MNSLKYSIEILELFKKKKGKREPEACHGKLCKEYAALKIRI